MAKHRVLGDKAYVITQCFGVPFYLKYMLINSDLNIFG